MKVGELIMKMARDMAISDGWLPSSVRPLRSGNELASWQAAESGTRAFHYWKLACVAFESMTGDKPNMESEWKEEP